jgi:hypothetical protein
VSNERFVTAALAENEDELKRFVVVLGAERVVPPISEPHLDAPLADPVRTGLALATTEPTTPRSASRCSVNSAHNAGVPVE